MANRDDTHLASAAPPLGLGRQSIAWDPSKRMSRRPSITEEEDFWEKARKNVGHAAPKTMFVDANAMKERLRETMCKPKYDVTDYYHKFGVFQAIARSSYFEKATLTVIAFNALWISVDTDNNKADVLLQADMQFQIAEHFFCTYFFFEWFVRFMAFRKKRNGFWFVFDSIMVFMMVMETWVMTMALLVLGGPSASGGMGNASILRLLRLLRLSRMARMARLLRCMPELLILVKGMKAAMRSVFFTLLLLFFLLYIFGIAFVQITADSASDDVRRYFASVPKSMHALLLDGTMLDDLGGVVTTAWKGEPGLGVLFWIFVLLSSLTVLNMLIGVLCEVVSAVAATEREELQVGFVKEKLTQLLVDEGLDEDGDHQISRAEFEKLLEKPGAARLLQEVDVDVLGLVDLADYIFEDEDEELGDKTDDEPYQLSFEKFMEVVLQLRGTNNATVKDIVDFRKFVKIRLSNFEERISRNVESALERYMPRRSASVKDENSRNSADKVRIEDACSAKISDAPLRKIADSKEALDIAPSVTTPALAVVTAPIAAGFAACAIPFPSTSGSSAAVATQWWQQAARVEWALAVAQRELVALSTLQEATLGTCRSAAAPGGDAAGGGAVGTETREDLRLLLTTKFGFPIPAENSPPWPSFAGPTPTVPMPVPSLTEQLHARLVGLGLATGISAAAEALREAREALSLDDLGTAPPIPALSSGSHCLATGAVAALTTSKCPGLSSPPPTMPSISSCGASQPFPSAGGDASATAVADVAPSVLRGRCRVSGGNAASVTVGRATSVPHGHDLGNGNRCGSGGTLGTCTLPP
eukprot:CAMPEP_0115440850 /NCGR_PEP_ID=MMETSP0271-20121206/36513_1 /TAXON_ID=71861 /ORGANISM="Scrippsiella trochoidea, Strain CCMP3099" /LENGTH=815 /DNA_ID=CAMNT_0002866603 /DNA_START=107 /DNA_END=2552 /DNA_ORIENTATION=-